MRINKLELYSLAELYKMQTGKKKKISLATNVLLWDIYSLQKVGLPYYKSYETICAQLGIQRRQAINIMNDLKKLGLVLVSETETTKGIGHKFLAPLSSAGKDWFFKKTPQTKNPQDVSLDKYKPVYKYLYTPNPTVIDFVASYSYWYNHYLDCLPNTYSFQGIARFNHYLPCLGVCTGTIEERIAKGFFYSLSHTGEEFCLKTVKGAHTYSCKYILHSLAEVLCERAIYKYLKHFEKCSGFVMRVEERHQVVTIEQVRNDYGEPAYSFDILDSDIHDFNLSEVAKKEYEKIEKAATEKRRYTDEVIFDADGYAKNTGKKVRR